MVGLVLGVLIGHLALLGWLQPATYPDAAVSPPIRFQLATATPRPAPRAPELSPTPSASPPRAAVGKVKTASAGVTQAQTGQVRPAENDTSISAPVANLTAGPGVADKTAETDLTGSAPAALAPTTTSAPSTVNAVSLPSQSADYLNNPSPSYPALSRRLGEQGKVVIRVLIDKDGRPQQGNIDQSSGYSRLDQAALRAVMGWRYVPGRRYGIAQDMWFNVPVHFALQ